MEEEYEGFFANMSECDGQQHHRYEIIFSNELSAINFVNRKVETDMQKVPKYVVLQFWSDERHNPVDHHVIARLPKALKIDDFRELFPTERLRIGDEDDMVGDFIRIRRTLYNKRKCTLSNCSFSSASKEQNQQSSPEEKQFSCTEKQEIVQNWLRQLENRETNVEMLWKAAAATKSTLTVFLENLDTIKTYSKGVMVKNYQENILLPEAIARLKERSISVEDFFKEQRLRNIDDDLGFFLKNLDKLRNAYNSSAHL